jgi:hypothetical protein
VALTKTDIDAVAERVLELGKERRDAEYEEWKTDQAENAKSPEVLAKRVTKLEESNFVNWPDVLMLCYATFILAIIVARPRRNGSD